MDYQAAVEDLRRRIAEVRAMLDNPDSTPVSFCSEPEPEIEPVVDIPKPKSDLDDLRAKLNKMKK